MKNDLIVILAHKRKTVADVHQATGIPLKEIADIYYQRKMDIKIANIAKICNYLNITLEEFFGIEIRLVRNQYRQNIMFRELAIRKIVMGEVIRKEEADD